MTATAFFGNALTAYGPALAVLLLYVALQAQLVLLLMTAAFFWLVSSLITSLIWYIITPMQDAAAHGLPATIFVGVTIQEAFRYAFFRLMKKADTGLTSISSRPSSRLNQPINAFVTGLGFGIMSGLISYISQLAESSGPAILPCASCPGTDVFFIGAITTCLFIFLHAAWNMIAFDGWYRGSWLPFAFSAACHYGASYGTLLTPSTVSNGCVISIAILAGLLAVCAALAVRTVDARLR
ncbi:gamma secretase complex protein [Geranomyces variabilis]|nr:gamma secretase complex protein [Geranomyces variabilis]